MKPVPLLFSVASAVIFFAHCKKTPEALAADPGMVPSVDTVKKVTTNNTSPLPQPTIDCTENPDYGDSIIYQETAQGDFYAYPKSQTAGTYLSWPDGLDIDPQTGAIDVTRSESGTRYVIGLVKQGTSDTCTSQLILNGSSYLDSIYITDKGGKNAAPYFNANPAAASICPPDGNCQFDISGHGKSKGLTINRETGFIDLVKSKDVFGKNPVNGMSVPVTIIYSLNDQGNNVYQQMTLNLVYYDVVTNIPAPVMTSITTKRANALGNELLTTGTNPKPPLIIITRYTK